jgi:hypothetical protein
MIGVTEDGDENYSRFEGGYRESRKENRGWVL